MARFRSLWTGVLILQLSRNVSAQAIPADCYKFYNYAALVYESVGPDESQLCDDGAFASAIDALISCSSASSPASSLITVSALQAALDICNATEVSGSVTGIKGISSSLSVAFDALSTSSICCGTDTAFQSYLRCPTIRTTLPFSVSACGQFLIKPFVCCGTDTGAQRLWGCSTIRTAFPISESSCFPFLAAVTGGSTSGSNGMASGSASASSRQGSTVSNPVESASNSPAPNDSGGRNSGLIAGVAVGASIGTLLLVAAIAFAIWRRRKHNKSKSVKAAVPQTQIEKAQLHSDHIKPDPKELDGLLSPRVRSVGGLEELETSYKHYPSSGVHEMSANEAAFREDTSASTKATGSSRT